MQFENKIVIIGGGLAGLIAALHLQKLNFQVTLIEKNSYPNHKVCGEYVSNEVLLYLNWLGISFEHLNPSSLTSLQLTSSTGASITTALPLGGFGLSRYLMDNHLYVELNKRGATVIQDTVADVVFRDPYFKVSTSTGKHFTAGQVLGAFGKRSSLDVKLKRNFIQNLSPYMAVKAHYRGAFQADLVGLHHFKGGYCGVSQVEDGLLNICYLATYDSFKRCKGIPAYQENVINKNKHMEALMANVEMVSDAPLTIGQISFKTKEPVLNHMLLIGDTAGLIHPLCGNGMAMAIHSAKLAAELTASFLREQSCSRSEFENKYSRAWRHNFSSRLSTGKVLSDILKYPTLQGIAIKAVTQMPGLLQRIIKSTHGKPISITS